MVAMVLVVARHLLNRKVKVKVYILGEEKSLSPECRQNLEIFYGCKVKFIKLLEIVSEVKSDTEFTRFDY